MIARTMKLRGQRSEPVERLVRGGPFDVAVSSVTRLLLSSA
jgi:hypothetical protein